IAEGGIGYAKDILEKALGPTKALEVINKLTVSLQVRPFDIARKTEPSQLINFIQNEHPQTIALILSYLRPQQSSMILSALTTEKQAEVAKRIALMDRTSPEVVKDVERVLEKKLQSLIMEDFSVTGGIQAIVDILNNVDRTTEKNIMETLETEDASLADEIRKKMFVFEDIINLDTRSIQTCLRHVDQNMLGIALKNASDAVKDVIFGSVTKRFAEMLQENMAFSGPVRIKDVEEAQQKIVNIIRNLEESGDIIVSRGGGDEIIA
ncbi:MAG: flagellar motor switch protein FliG, partial [Oscillospiraceae bacterium]|nr:flagellar motor switch protein FliG [Oscillospiraceae bacterium]